MIPLLLLLAAPASAHLPHDNAGSLAAPPDLNPELPWYLVGKAAYADLLYRSEDGGKHWQMVGGAPVADELIDAGAVMDGTAVLLTVPGYWYRAPDDADWTYVEMPYRSSALAAWGDEIWVATLDGIYRGEPGSELSVQMEGREFNNVRVTEHGAVAVEDGQSVWLDQGSSWAELGSPSEHTLLVAILNEDRVYAGDSEGNVYVFDLQGSEWRECAALPEPGADTYTDIVNMAIHQDELLVATAWRAPFVAPASCSAWEGGRVSPLDTVYGQTGSASAPEEGGISLWASGPRWIHTGWNGFAITEDAGNTWHESSLIPPDYSRGLTISPSFADNGLIYVATEGGGPIVTQDGGASWSGQGEGLTSTNTQFMDVLPDGETVVALVGHQPWRSTDRGESWEELPTAFELVFRMEYLTGPDRMWALAGTEGDHAMVVERREGDTGWTELSSLDESLGRIQLAGAHQLDDGAICVLTVEDPQVWCSDDDAESFELRLERTATQASDFVAIPWEGGQRLLFVADEAVVYTDDSGQSWSAYEDGAADLFAVSAAANGDLYAASADGQVWRSSDGGASFATLGVYVPSLIYQVVPRPDFREGRDQLLLPTHDGSYVLRDALGESPWVERFGSYQYVDDGAGFVLCDTETCGEALDEDDASAGSFSTLTLIRTGDAMWITVRGHTIRLHGQVDGACIAQLWVDGELQAELGEEASDGVEVLFEAELDEGVHDVELRGTAGACLLWDGLEVIGTSTTLPWGKDLPPEDTGDSGGSDSGGSDSDPPDDSLPPETGDSGGGGDDDPRTVCGCTSRSGRTGGLAALFLGLTFITLRRR